MKEVIRIVGEECTPVGEERGRILAGIVRPCALFLALVGIAGCLLSSFLVPYSPQVLYPALFVICLFWYGFSRLKIEGVNRLLAVLAVFIACSVLLLVLQNAVISGFLQTANCVLATINNAYAGNLILYQAAGNTADILMFLFFLFFLTGGFLSAGFLYRPNIWILLALVFPVVMGTLLAGGSPDPLSLMLLFLSVVGLTGASHRESPVMQVRLYLLRLVLSLPLSFFSFLCIQPVLTVPVEQVRQTGMKSENGILQKLQELLPKISGGRLSLAVEGIGGGVDEGVLGETKGFYFGDTKGLEVTCSQKPEETMYLKGYVGAVYTGDSFGTLEAKNFEDASANWNTDGNPSLYIGNLPFLRMMYQENVSFSDEDDPQLSGDVSSSAWEIQVKNLDANPSYTYVPYNAYLNDYYEIQAGDGAVRGQTVAEDIFSYYPRGQYEEAMQEWNEQEEHQGVLDRAEASYDNFVKENYLQVPREIFGRRLEEYQAMDLEDVEEIKTFIQETLAENYTFNMDVEPLPEGRDFVQWFLDEKKEGYSTHFAAAATMMFRMFGVPARYVVGYVAPAEIFSVQSDGTYTAVLEDDNAHAWTEIYVSGVGWEPVETTPGFVGMLETGTYTSEKEVNEPVGDTQSTPEQEEVQPPEETKETKAEIPVVPIAVLSLLALLLFSVFIRRSHLRRRRCGRLAKLGVTVNIRNLYRSFYELLCWDGWDAALGCSDVSFPRAVSEKYEALSEEEVRRIAALVLAACYGRQRPKEEEIIFLRMCYGKLRQEIRRQLSFKRRVLFYMWKCF